MRRTSIRVKLTIGLHVLLTLVGTLVCGAGFAQEIWTLEERGAFDRRPAAPVSPSVAPAPGPVAIAPTLPPARPLPPPEIHAWATALEAAGYVVDPAQIREPAPYTNAGLVATRGGHRYTVTLYEYAATPVVDGRRRSFGRAGPDCAITVNYWGDADPAVAAGSLLDAVLAHCPTSADELGTLVRAAGYPITEEPSGDRYDDTPSTFSVRYQHEGELSIGVEVWSPLVAPLGPGRAHRAGEHVVLVTTDPGDPDPAGAEALASLLLASD
jgi:hypothetical protein